MLHSKLKVCVVNFVGKQAAIVLGMRYVTYSAILYVLIGKVQIYIKLYSCFILGILFVL